MSSGNSYVNHTPYESEYEKNSVNSNTRHSYEDDINFDLLRPDQLLDSSDSRIPILDESFVNGMFENNKYVDLEVQSSMEHPYLLLEFGSGLLLKFIICSNTFLFAYIGSLDESQESNLIVRYILIRLMNFAFVAMIPYVFTTADTFKSINVLLEYLLINIIIFEYEFSIIIKYIAIHILAGVLAAVLSYAVFYEYSKNLTLEQILPNISVSSFQFRINYSYILVTIIVHFCLSIALTIISNNATSMNAKKKTVYKAVCLLLCGLVTGYVIGPAGYILPRLCLYCVVVLAKGKPDAFNTDMFISYIIVILCTIIAYPFIAIQIKFFWRNRYRRYLEYGTLK